ncbi:hypothetical protein A6R68_22005, partial [Neotoma lepida]
MNGGWLHPGQQQDPERVPPFTCCCTCVVVSKSHPFASFFRNTTVTTPCTATH